MMSTIIIGGGPGGLGPLLWAAQAGVLADWLQRGVAIVDRQSALGGTLGRYVINSDSLGGAYLEFLAAPGTPAALRALKDEAVTRQMEEYHDGFPPLDLVDRFLRRLGVAMEKFIAVYPGSAFRPGTDVRSLHLHPDGSIEARIVGPDGVAERMSARTAVVALGGRQNWIRQLLGCSRLALEHCHPTYIIPSDRVLSHSGLNEADQVLRADSAGPIVILGGSHSAYSAAWTLADLLPQERLAKRQVFILQRHPPRIFYPSRMAALADDYPVADGDICPRTQRVNRLGGLRGDGREMWRRIAGRPGLPRDDRFNVLQLDDLTAQEIRALIESAALVVPAFGYRSATLPIFDADGRRLALNADIGGRNVAQDCRLLQADGTPLPNIFGIGLGTGFRPFGPMGGEPNFTGQANSLWLYQNGIGAMVHRGVFEVLDGLPPSPERSTGSEASSASRPRAFTNVSQSAQ